MNDCIPLCKKCWANVSLSEVVRKWGFNWHVECLAYTMRNSDIDEEKMSREEVLNDIRKAMR